MALLGGQSLAAHDSPDAASLQVLSGTVVLTSNADRDVQLSSNDHTPIPQVRHALHALEDAVVMISVGQDVEPERLKELDEHKGT
jgi:quercetin dioxygenase-like cupin family protein